MRGNGDLEEQFPSLELVLNQLQYQLKAQSELWDQIDRRLEILVGFVGVIFAAIFALGRFEDLNCVARVFIIISTVLLAVSAGLTAIAWWPRRFGFPPRPDYLFENYSALTPAQTRLDIATSIVEAYNSNERLIDEKVGAFKRAFALAMIGVLALASAVITLTVS
ncbi:MAG TPA: hypothetical protein VNL15_04200 [Dehalococcoidia bacterium]|nr:hypothetical protein [Dehalococcoidia bacterium]